MHKHPNFLRTSILAESGGRLNKRCRLTSIGITMLKIRRSRQSLIFNMRIHIPGKDGFFIHIQRKPITTFFTEYSWCYYDRQFAGQYLYTLNVTRSGRPCVAWWDYAQAIPSVIPLHVLSPSNRMYDDAFYPDGSIRDARNYCRNPETAPFQIWCYIAVALASWELCSPEECPNLGWYLYNMA